jgi:hypothetical protein
MDDIAAIIIRDNVDHEELMKDPQRVLDHVVARTGLKDLQFGEFRYLGIWVSVSHTESDPLP